MKRTLNRRYLSCILVAGTAVVAALFLTRVFAADTNASKPQTKTPQTVPANAVANRKANIEQQAPPIPVNLADLSKNGIESPTKQLVAARTIPGAAPSASEFVNPKVEPGKVRWHTTFSDACAAAKKSGKPVLLFQMMGKLDERFC